MFVVVMTVRNKATYATYLPFFTKMISKALSRFKDQGLLFGKEWNDTGVPSHNTYETTISININEIAFAYEVVQQMYTGI